MSDDPKPRAVLPDGSFLYTHADPRPPTPPGMSWEMTRCAASYEATSYRDALLAAKWEPISVDQGVIWFRRPKA